MDVGRQPDLQDVFIAKLVFTADFLKFLIKKADII